MNSCNLVVWRRAAALLIVLACSLVVPAYAAENPAQAIDLEQLQQDWAEAIDSLVDYSADQRDAAVAKAGEALEQMDKTLAELEVRTAEEWADMSEEARNQRAELMRELETQRRYLAEWYGAMKHGSEQAWTEVKTGFIGAYQLMQEAWRDAVDEF